MIDKYIGDYKYIPLINGNEKYNPINLFGFKDNIFLKVGCSETVENKIISLIKRNLL